MSHLRLLTAVSIIAACVVVCLAVLADSPVSDDEKAIRALGDRINLAWRCDNGPSVMAEVLSEKSFAFSTPDPQNPSRAVVLDRQGFLNAFERIMAQNRPLRHTNTMKGVAVAGPLACVVAVLEDVSKDGKSHTENAMLFFAREEAGWRLTSYSPLDNVERALRQFRELGQ